MATSVIFVKFCNFTSSRVWQIHVVGTAPTFLLMKILHFFLSDSKTFFLQCHECCHLEYC